jgi:hypothetical protein
VTELGFTESGLSWYETPTAKIGIGAAVVATAAKFGGVF